MAHSLVRNGYIELITETETFIISGNALRRSSTLQDWSIGSIPKSVDKNGAVDFSHHDAAVVRTIVAYLQTGSRIPVSETKEPTFYVKLYKLAGSLGLNEEFLSACLNQLRSRRYDVKTLLEIMYHVAGARLTEDPEIMEWMTEQITRDMEKLEESELLKDVIENGGEGGWRIHSVIMASLKLRNKQLQELRNLRVLQPPTPDPSLIRSSSTRAQQISIPSRNRGDSPTVPLVEKSVSPNDHNHVRVENRTTKSAKRNLNATVEDAPESDEEVEAKPSANRSKKGRYSI